MKLWRGLSILLVMLSLVACASGEPGEPITGVFIDSTVQGLGYECGDDGVRLFTNEDGEFTCAVGDEIRFYVGQILLGSVVATGNLDVVTPAMLVGASLNEMLQFGYGGMGGDPSDQMLSAAFMGALLQSLDEDSYPSNGIVIPAAVHALLTTPGTWVFDDESGPTTFDQIVLALDELEIDFVDAEEAFFHMLEQSASLLQGQFSGTIVEGEDTVHVDLFVSEIQDFEFLREEGAAEGPSELRLEGLLIVSMPGEDAESFEFEIGEPWLEGDNELFVLDYALDAVTVRVYDFEGIIQNQLEPVFDEETGQFDWSSFAPHLIATVVLDKMVSPPDVTLRDVGDFLASTPNGADVPEDLELMPFARVEIYAYVQGEIMFAMADEGPEQGQIGGDSLYVNGQAKHVGMEGYFEQFMIGDAYAVLSSLDEQSLVYRGRAFYYYMDGVGEESEEFETWGDVTVTISVDGSPVLTLAGDDGSAFEETLDVDYAGVGMSEF